MFNDITYDKLTAITEKEKPYRGRAQEEYPYDVRSHGSKYFTIGKDYYDIHYDKTPLLRIHKGNIVEYIHDNFLYQGQITILNKFHEQGSFRQGWWSNGYQLTQMQSRGGLCIAKITNRNKREYDIYPFRKGMKFDMYSDIPITKYDVYARQVDRKKSFKSYKEHENDFTILDTTFKGIDDPKLAMNFCSQVLKDNPLGDYADNHDAWVTLARAKSQIDGLICSARTDIKYWHSYRWDRPESIIDMIGKSYKDYLNEHYNNFKVAEYPCEKKYFPTNKLLKIQMRGEE
jgi:hypothetical protein